MNKKIASLVLNSVSNDARVLKEANSLQSAGYQVTIFGLKLKSDQKDHETLPSGVVIQRMDYYGGKARFLLINAASLFLPVVGKMLSLLAKQQRRFHLRQEMIEEIYRRIFTPAVLEWKPDFIHAHDLSALPLAVHLKKNLNVALIYDSHEIFEEMADKKEFQKPRLIEIQRKLSEQVDAFITINQSIAKYLQEKYPKLPEAHIVKNASVFEESDLKADYDGRLHQAANISSDEKIVLYQGGFTEGRGLESLIESAKMFPDGWVLVLMGWGPLEETLKKRAHGSDKIRIIPGAPQEDLSLWTRGATVGLIPYINNCLNHWYCTPNKLWEYPRSGVPVVASGFPELREMVVPNRLGKLVDDFEDSNQLPHLLRSLDDTKLNYYREGCLSFIQEDNWSHAEKELLKVYEGLQSNQ